MTGHWSVKAYVNNDTEATGHLSGKTKEKKMNSHLKNAQNEFQIEI